MDRGLLTILLHAKRRVRRISEYSRRVRSPCPGQNGFLGLDLRRRHRIQTRARQLDQLPFPFLLSSIGTSGTNWIS
ncbi:MAG: hypothetical protein CL933_08730 [Deltaproteobacteria bacterium]|nr:hypothetical protein [Deltaproteobacteria bacterium]